MNEDTKREPARITQLSIRTSESNSNDFPLSWSELGPKKLRERSLRTLIASLR